MKSLVIGLALSTLLLSPGDAWGADSERGIVLYFSATWCGPCQQVAPVVSKLKREGLPIRKVDIDQEKALASRFQVDRIPTFVLVVDGKQVDRQTGYMTESDLRRMIARIPKPQAPAVQLAQESDEHAVLPVSLGVPGQIPRPKKRPAPEPPVETGDEQEGNEGGIRSLWPFGKRNADEPIVRGNDVSLGEPGDFGSGRAQQPQQSATPSDPMAASVRIRVHIDGKVNLGSGTVIASGPGNSRILTCGHIFRGFNDDAKIEVDLFDAQGSRLYIARLEKYDEQADVGLISVPTDAAVPVAKVAARDGNPRVGEPVSGVGCSGGALPTREAIRVTALDKYDGPSNIECTGLPVQGRSGGGLFNRSGQVVGVCIAADKDANRGLYAGLSAIQELLDECQLTQLYQSAGSASEANIQVAAVEDSPHPFAAATPPPARGPVPSVPVTADGNIHPVDVNAGQAEVVVIIRDKGRPNAPNRVVIIHDASSKFLGYLNGELTENEEQPFANTSTTSSRGFRLSASNPAGAPSAVPSFSATPKPALHPTSLMQPLVPRRYRRSDRPQLQTLTR